MRLGKKGIELVVFGLPVVCYGVVAIVLGMRHRELMNADAVCYIRRAEYLLHGDFVSFLSEHWSLMLSWLIAPLMAMKIDGLYAARIVSGVVGVFYMIVFVALARRILEAHWVWHLLTGLVIAPFMAAVAMRGISPDLLLAAWLGLYFWIVLSRGWPRSGRLQFLAGIVGGFAYLAKAFALPFVIAHLIITLLIRSREPSGTGANSGGAGAIGLAYARGLLGFFLIAAPWIGAISWKYGHVTFGSAGAAAHGMTGSRVLPGFRPPVQMDYFLPPPPYIAPLETPERIYMHWSPFASRVHFKYQLGIIAKNALVLREYLSEKAPPHLLLGMMGVAVVLLLVRSAQRWKLAWMLLTLGLFLGPFLVVIIQQRYLNPHVVPLGLLLCLMLALRWRPENERKAISAGNNATISWWRAGLALLVLASFLWSGIQWMRPMFQRGTPATFRLMGKKIRQQRLEGVYASDSRLRGMLVAYHSGQKYVGFPATRHADVAERMLHDLGVRYLMVWDEQREYEQQSCAPLIVKNEGWTQALRFHGATIYRYAAVAGPNTRPTTRQAAASEKASDSAGDDEEGEEDLSGIEKSGGRGRIAHQARKKMTAR